MRFVLLSVLIFLVGCASSVNPVLDRDIASSDGSFSKNINLEVAVPNSGSCEYSYYVAQRNHMIEVRLDGGGCLSKPRSLKVNLTRNQKTIFCRSTLREGWDKDYCLGFSKRGEDSYGYKSNTIDSNTSNFFAAK